MLKFKIQTPQEAEQELKNALTVYNTMRGQDYFTENDYKPETLVQEIKKSVGEFYSFIDTVGNRLLSDLYLENSPEGRSYRDETHEMFNLMLKDLEGQLRQGLITPDVYNNIMAYATRIIGAATSGINPFIRGVIQKQSTTTPQTMLNNLLSANFTQLSTGAISELAHNLGDTNREIKELVDALKAKAQEEIMGDPSVAAGAIDSAPLVTLRDGEASTFGMSNIAPDNQAVVANRDDPLAAEIAQSAINSWKRLEAESIDTKDSFNSGYGARDVINITETMTTQAIKDNLPPAEYQNNLETLSSKFRQQYNDFDYKEYLNSYMTLYIQIWEAQERNRINQQNALLSDESVASGSMTASLRNQDRVDAVADDGARTLPHSVQEQQNQAHNAGVLADQVGKGDDDDDDDSNRPPNVQQQIKMCWRKFATKLNDSNVSSLLGSFERKSGLSADDPNMLSSSFLRIVQYYNASVRDFRFKDESQWDNEDVGLLSITPTLKMIEELGKYIVSKYPQLKSSITASSSPLIKLRGDNKLFHQLAIMYPDATSDQIIAEIESTKMGTAAAARATERKKREEQTQARQEEMGAERWREQMGLDDMVDYDDDEEFASGKKRGECKAGVKVGGTEKRTARLMKQQHYKAPEAYTAVPVQPPMIVKIGGEKRMNTKKANSSGQDLVFR